MSEENQTPSDKGPVNVEGTFAEAWAPERVGDQITAVYLGSQDAMGKRGVFKAYHLKLDNGKRVSISGASLNTKMPQIPKKTRITVTYKGTQAMDRGDMKLFDVAVPPGTKLIDPFDDE